MPLKPIVVVSQGFRENQILTKPFSGSSLHLIGIRGLAWLNPRRESVPGTSTFMEARR